MAGRRNILRGEQLKIWRSAVRAGRPGAVAGEVLSADAGGIEIACGAGSLALLSVQLPGKKRVSTADFLHAHALAGDRLT